MQERVGDLSPWTECGTKPILVVIFDRLSERSYRSTNSSGGSCNSRWAYTLERPHTRAIQQLSDDFTLQEMSSFEVQPCTEADIPRVFEIISLAFAHNHEYVDALFPAHDTPAGRRVGTERMLQIFQGDSYGHFIKVDDHDSGKLIAAAKWNIYEGGEIPPQPAIDGDYWDSEEDKEFAQSLFHAFFAPRQKAIEETNGHLIGRLQPCVVLIWPLGLYL